MTILKLVGQVASKRAAIIMRRQFNRLPTQGRLNKHIRFAAMLVPALFGGLSMSGCSKSHASEPEKKPSYPPP
jgi:hypothetical protein